VKHVMSSVNRSNVNRSKHVAYISPINICCADVSSQFVI